jgi:signal transduction histidine kinase
MRDAKRAKPARTKVEPELAAARKALRNEAAKRRDLEKGLAESLGREKATGEILKEKNRALTEALEQQTATAEVLRVIGTSPIDTQPVFAGIARSGVRVCGAQSCTLFVVDGDMLRVAATHGVPAERVERFRTQFPMPVTAENHFTQVLHERRIVHLVDIEHNPAATPEHIENARLGAYRTRLMVPMLRGDSALGLIAVTHQAPTPFSVQQIALLQTFADQAVIAIENVRLFTELEARNRDLTESLEQQTATSEILRVISSSTTDLQPVFDALLKSAVKLCVASHASLFQVDQGVLRHISAYGTMRGAAPIGGALAISPGSGPGQAVLERRTIHVHDMESKINTLSPDVAATIKREGVQSTLSVPLLRGGDAVGVIIIRRKEAGPFAEKQIRLLETFADQAVIAIENARLFREIADKSRQLEAASRHKSEFLANMSHELRTPLNAVIGFSEVLAQGMFGDINEKQTEYLQDILESGRHLLSLINDILDLSKIEAGRMELEPADFDLPSAIDNALILVRERASRRGITLGSTIDARLGLIHGDERKVKQVLLNLLSNALKFTPEGGRIDVGAGLHDAVAEVSVADTGIGIAPADQEAVFEEFRQVGTAEKRAEGTGLGLALSRKFIELHGGKIWVQSEVGRGSTFTFTLPVRPWPAS